MSLKRIYQMLSVLDKIVSFTLHIIHLLEVFEVLSQTSDDLSLIITGLRFLLLLTRLIQIYLLLSHFPCLCRHPLAGIPKGMVSAGLRIGVTQTPKWGNWCHTDTKTGVKVSERNLSTRKGVP